MSEYEDLNYSDIFLAALEIFPFIHFFALLQWEKKMSCN